MEQMFATAITLESRWLLIIKRAMLCNVVFHLFIGAISSYRAYFQVHSLDLQANGILQDGAVVQSKVVTYGRSFVDVRLELIQNGQIATLQEQGVAANEFGFYDPRTQTSSISATITLQTLNRFSPGPAIIRATAVGRPQWMRIPPPVIREVAVTIMHP